MLLNLAYDKINKIKFVWDETEPEKVTFEVEDDELREIMVEHKKEILKVIKPFFYTIASQKNLHKLQENVRRLIIEKLEQWRN